MKKREENKEGNKAPAYEVRLNHVRCTVWENHGENGTWFNVTITRRFKDGEEWKESNVWNGLGDLALVREAIDMARDFIRLREFEVERRKFSTESMDDES